jgi:hypothetical protein
MLKEMDKKESVYKTSLLLVKHFSYCAQRNGKGIHSRIFSYILHPEAEFVAIGRSQEVINGADPYPEHVVPCATLISESIRLINEGMPESEIAELLAKHWKIVFISKEQAKYLDSKDGKNLKDKMPPGWKFETGNTFERLKLANIEVLPLS